MIKTSSTTHLHKGAKTLPHMFERMKSRTQLQDRLFSLVRSQDTRFVESSPLPVEEKIRRDRVKRKRSDMNAKYRQLCELMKTGERENIRKILDVLLNYQKLTRVESQDLIFVPKLTLEALGVVIKDSLELGLPMEQCRAMLSLGMDTQIVGQYEDYNVLTQALHEFVCDAASKGVDRYYCLYVL